MATNHVKGGKKLAKFIRNSKRGASAGPPLLQIGFQGRQIAVLAAALEFGNPSTNLPERPAFRAGIAKLPEVVKAWQETHLQGRNWTAGLVIPNAAYVALAILARDAIRQSYLEYHSSAGLSDTQEARKRGTPGAGQELIGHEGPKLVGHIKAYVDGGEVN